MATQGNLATTEIDVKQAVQRAKDFAVELFKPEKISHLGLEAVERTDDSRYWLVTLGFVRPGLHTSGGLTSQLDQILPRKEPREYKVFRIDAQSGAVIGMEMFE